MSDFVGNPEDMLSHNEVQYIFSSGSGDNEDDDVAYYKQEVGVRPDAGNTSFYAFSKHVLK